MASGAIVNNDPTLGTGKKDLPSLSLSLLLALHVQREHLVFLELKLVVPSTM